MKILVEPAAGLGEFQTTDGTELLEFAAVSASRGCRRAVPMLGEAKPEALDFDKLAANAQAAVKPEALGQLAGNLGLSVESLQRFGVGWSVRHRAWTFPMRKAAGDVVGIRLRFPSGRKLSVKGGREGLFIPEGLQPGGRLLVGEGPTDAAALLDLGFQAVGRPNSSGGVKHLCELVRRLHSADVAIVADSDSPGQRGAELLAATLAAYVPTVKVIAPPDGVKDARQWKRAGAKAADVRKAIDAAEPRRLAVSVTTKAGGRNGRR